VRFRDKFPETIGGWAQEEMHTFKGIGRGIHTWVDFLDNEFLCVGTSVKFYLLVGAEKYDITPLRKAKVSVSNVLTCSAATGSVVTVTDTAHGAQLGDFIYFALVTDDIGTSLTPAIMMNRDGFEVIEVVNEDSYKIDVGTAAVSTTTLGGGSTEIEYKVTSGVVADVSGSGWGVSTWGGEDITPTEYAFDANPVSTLASPNHSRYVFNTNSAGLDIKLNDYIYVTGLTDTATGVDLTLLNNKWWLVVGRVNLGTTTSVTINTHNYKTSAAPETLEGGTSAKFYWDEVAAVPDSVHGATRGWGEATEASAVTDALRMLTIQNFGEDLIFCNKGGPLYYYDTSSNVTTGIPADNSLGVVIDETIVGSSEPPVVINSFLVNEEHGHCMVFSTNDIDSTTQNNMLIRWSDRHNPFVWLPNPINEAGGRVLREGSRILGGIHGKEETIIFTNTAIYTCRYIGYPETYGFKLVSRNVTAYSRGSYVAVDNMVFFMGKSQFYVYDGSIQPLPKNLVNYVFDDINDSQKEKCFSGVNSKFTEVYWFYPSSDSFEADRWVAYNYSNNTWTYGSFDMSALDQSQGSDTSLNRTSWHDANIFDTPLATYVKEYAPDSVPPVADSGLMKHEIGTSANGSSITHTIKSGQVDLSEGGMFTHYSRLIPDVDRTNSTGSNPSEEVTLTIEGMNIPGRDEVGSSSVTVSFAGNTTSGLNYAPDYNENAISGRAQTVSFEATSASTGFGWRLGTLRLDLKPDGEST
tara:strand:+ start:1459 stop:3708 length:2250 start_codon:yes stop_codon:yes gene_type:complete